MRLRFLQTTASSAPAYPFQAGQIIVVSGLTPEMKTWIRDGRAELVKEEPELAVMPSGERAVLGKGKRR